MVKYQCDKCKKVMNREEVKEYFNDKTIFHLCDSCERLLENWINEYNTNKIKLR